MAGVDLHKRLRFLDAINLTDEQQWRVTEVQNYMDEGEVERYWIAKYVVWMEMMDDFHDEHHPTGERE